MIDSDWLTLLATDPGHGEVWQAYTEWLQDELGDQERVDAVRWVIDNKKFPYKNRSAFAPEGIQETCWDFWVSIGPNFCCLPVELWSFVKRDHPPKQFKEFKSCEDALLNLLDALVKFNRVFTKISI